MEKKRAVLTDAEADDGQPPNKIARTGTPPSPQELHAQPPALSSSQSAEPSASLDADMPSADPTLPQDPDDDPLVKYQRAQLAARITEQNRDILWLREKVNELQKLVAVLGEAPRAALYHMSAVLEDLTLTISRLGLAPEIDDACQCPLSVTFLEAEIVTNDSLAEIPAALKKRTSQIVHSMGRSTQQRL